jgi:hypothetical protein
MNIRTLTFKDESNKTVVFENVNSFSFLFLNSKFNFENSFNELRIRTNENRLFISSCDAIRAYLCSKNGIIAEINSNNELMFDINKIAIDGQRELRECSFKTNRIEIVIEDRTYEISVNLNDISISPIDSDFLVIKPVVSNVVSFIGVDK